VSKTSLTPFHKVHISSARQKLPPWKSRAKMLEHSVRKERGTWRKPLLEGVQVFLFLDRVPVLMDLGLASEVRGSRVHYFLHGLAGMGSVGP
jgi:hypothetical protein